MTGIAESEHHEASVAIAALSDGALRHACNSTVFQRGETCAASGAVAVTSEEPGSTPTIRATVAGTEPYCTEVWIHDGNLGGDCTCAHAQDGS